MFSVKKNLYVGPMWMFLKLGTWLAVVGSFCLPFQPIQKQSPKLRQTHILHCSPFSSKQFYLVSDHTARMWGESEFVRCPGPLLALFFSEYANLLPHEPPSTVWPRQKLNIGAQLEQTIPARDPKFTLRCAAKACSEGDLERQSDSDSPKSAEWTLSLCKTCTVQPPHRFHQPKSAEGFRL